MAEGTDDRQDTHAIVDAALKEWRQGDCAIGEFWFAHRIEPSHPLTEAAAPAAGAGATLAEAQELGAVILTQSCDILRSCRERPYVEVSPLVEVSAESIHHIERGRQPRYAFVPGVADRRLVADLDRSMTVEKAVVATWNRTEGCTTDPEIRAFAQALARKKARFAFPDDFVRLVNRLQRRVVDKHEKQTDEGAALRSLREIRVRAAPSWDHPDSVELMIWFIRDDGGDVFEQRRWAQHLQAWIDLVPATGRFVNVEGQVVFLDEMTARDLVESDPLDLDHLSTGSPGAEGDEGGGS